MKKITTFFALIISLALLNSCSGELEQHTITTPVLQLKATGPLFQGSNTATAEWNYTLKELFPDLNGKINIESAKITAIKIMALPDKDYPELGKLVMEMKPKDAPMMRVGLLSSNFKPAEDNTLEIADVQEDLDEAFASESLIFVGDFDLLADEYYDDMVFNLVVTFDIETSI